MINLVAERLEKINYTPDLLKVNKTNVYKNTSINSVIDLILKFIDVDPQLTKIIETTSIDDVDSIQQERFQNIVNLRWLNDIFCLDTFLNAVNRKLPLNGTFICRAETEGQRYKRILKKFPKLFFYIYYSIDFFFLRFLPKWGPTRYIYHFLIKRDTKVLSLAHMLGLFVFCGFRIKYIKNIDNLAHFVLEKSREPSTNPKPSSGIIFKMKRVGRNGNIITIYKLRTMHPYSEYIQDFVYNLNGSENGDKITDDFRVASWGKFLRKYWIDELPMLFNLLKGDIKLVGVRPLSQSKFKLYPPDIQSLRISSKPGLIPPFYFDIPASFEELLDSEKKYLLAYKKNPFITDTKYFIQCWINIFYRKARSA